MAASERLTEQEVGGQLLAWPPTCFRCWYSG
jgi:hypothetical protein